MGRAAWQKRIKKHSRNDQDERFKRSYKSEVGLEALVPKLICMRRLARLEHAGLMDFQAHGGGCLGLWGREEALQKAEFPRRAESRCGRAEVG
jgi:hypothetical protein